MAVEDLILYDFKKRGSHSILVLAEGKRPLFCGSLSPCTHPPGSGCGVFLDFLRNGEEGIRPSE